MARLRYSIGSNYIMLVTIAVCDIDLHLAMMLLNEVSTMGSAEVVLYKKQMKRKGSLSCATICATRTAYRPVPTVDLNCYVGDELWKVVSLSAMSAMEIILYNYKSFNLRRLFMNDCPLAEFSDRIKFQIEKHISNVTYQAFRNRIEWYSKIVDTVGKAQERMKCLLQLLSRRSSIWRRPPSRKDTEAYEHHTWSLKMNSINGRVPNGNDKSFQMLRDLLSSLLSLLQSGRLGGYDRSLWHGNYCVDKHAEANPFESDVWIMCQIGAKCARLLNVICYHLQLSDAEYLRNFIQYGIFTCIESRQNILGLVCAHTSCISGFGQPIRRGSDQMEMEFIELGDFYSLSVEQCFDVPM